MPHSNTNEFNLNDDQMERLAEAIVEKLFIKQEEADAKFLADLEESNSNAQIYVVNNDGSVLSELEQQIQILQKEFDAALKNELYNTAADLDLKLKMLKKKLNKKKITSEKQEKFEVVFVKNGEKAALRVIKTGIQDDSNIEVLSGLIAGDEVITGPYNTVTKSLKCDDLIDLIQEEEQED